MSRAVCLVPSGHSYPVCVQICFAPQVCVRSLFLTSPHRGLEATLREQGSADVMAQMIPWHCDVSSRVLTALPDLLLVLKAEPITDPAHGGPFCSSPPTKRCSWADRKTSLLNNQMGHARSDELTPSSGRRLPRWLL